MSASAAKHHIESLLRARKLDGTLTSWPEGRSRDLAPTGLEALDRALEGGLPRGHLSEWVGPTSSGRTGLAYAAMAAAAARGELVAFIDTADVFDLRSAEAHAIELSRVLWVRGTAADSWGRNAGRADARGELALAHATRAGRREFEAARDRAGLALDRAIKAMHLVAQAGVFGLVVLDLVDVPERTLGYLPFTTWRRLQRAFEGQQVVGLILSARPVGRSAGGVTLQLERAADGLHWTVEGPRARLLHGLHVRGRFESAQRTVSSARTIGLHLTSAHGW